MTSQSKKIFFLAMLGILVAPALVFAQGTASAGTGLTAAATVTASTGSGVTVSATVTAKMKAAIGRADQEITRRVTALNALNTRVSQMQKVTDAFKQALETTIQGQVSALTTLQAKIDADTDLTTLKADIQSVTASYRIFALVLPQGRIAAAADRTVTISGMMTTLGTKLQTRIAAMQAGGTDVTALSAALSDLSAKITDATAQAQQSVMLSAALMPDGGDKTKMAANAAALKTARGDLTTAQKDLVAGRKDIATIMAGLKVSAGATATTTTTTQ